MENRKIMPFVLRSTVAASNGGTHFRRKNGIFIEKSEDARESIFRNVDSI